MPTNPAARGDIIEESFNYPHSLQERMTALAEALRPELPEVGLEEAAPLFPLRGTANIWHWFFNCLPKVLVLEASGFSGPYIVNMNCPFIPESMELLGNSEFTITPHGANTTLALFQKRNSILMELFGNKYINYCNAHMISLLRLLYIPVCQDAHDSPAEYPVTSESKREDFPINVELIAILLKNLKNGRYGF